MGSHSLLGSKALSKCEVNPTMRKINSVQGLIGIKVISKCEVNPTSGFQDIAYTSNCGQTDRQTDRRPDRQMDRRTSNCGRTDRQTGPFWRAYKKTITSRNNQKRQNSDNHIKKQSKVTKHWQSQQETIKNNKKKSWQETIHLTSQVLICKSNNIITL